MADNPFVRVCENCGKRRHVLTRRQVEVIKELVANPDASYNDLARQMTVSPHTVRHHFAAIYKRLGVSSRLGCVTACLTLGIIGQEEIRRICH